MDARLYVNASIEKPWYVELAAGTQGAEYALGAVTAGPTRQSARLPLHWHAAVGRGRIYPIASRVRLQRLERAWREQGVLSGPLPMQTGRQILLIWWALRNELGYAQRLACTLQAIEQAGLLRGEANQQALYAFGRILLDPAAADRWEGYDSRMVVRHGLFLWGAPPKAGLTPATNTMVWQIRHRHVLNVDVNSAWSYEAIFSMAARRLDRADNTPMASLIGVPTIDHARWAMLAPAQYQRFFYDTAYNAQGAVALRARLGVGIDAASARFTARGYTNAMAGVGAEATWYRGRATGLSAGIDTDMGYAFGQWAYTLGVQLRAELGRRQAVWVGPTDVVDEADAGVAKAQ